MAALKSTHMKLKLKKEWEVNHGETKFPNLKHTLMSSTTSWSLTLAKLIVLEVKLVINIAKDSTQMSCSNQLCVQDPRSIDLQCLKTMVVL